MCCALDSHRKLLLLERTKNLVMQMSSQYFNRFRVSFELNQNDGDEFNAQTVFFVYIIFFLNKIKYLLMKLCTFSFEK